MIRSVAVGSNTLKPFTHALALGFYFRVPTEGSCKRLFSLHLHKSTRGFHPSLVAVLTTNTDKRGELALLSLGEHPSGKC